MDEPRTPGVYTSRGTVDGEDWPAVAAALNQRMAALRVGQQELSQRCGVSVSTLRALQHGASGRRVQNKTLAAIARALDWPEDHLTRLLRASTGHDDTPGLAEQLAATVTRIDQSLREISQRLAAIERAVTQQS